MAALVASRLNLDLRIKYQKLLTAGKSPKVALATIMRKLIILTDTLVKQNRIKFADYATAQD